MIVENLNVREVGGSLKSLNLNIFLDKIKLDLIFIQETMVGAAKARDVFAKLLLKWHFCGVDSIGISRGLLMAWNPCKSDFGALLTPTGIFLEGVIKDTTLKFKMINGYGSYADKVVFWEDLKRFGIFDVENLIMGGDLNFTILSMEFWGDVARVDPLQHYFSHLVQVGGLVDVEPVKIISTWRNGRKGQGYIAKRLDHFLISENILSSGIIY
jgi:hypothetical protein